MPAAALFGQNGTPPTAGGYALIFIVPLFVVACLYGVLLAYYRHAENAADDHPIRLSVLASMRNLVSVVAHYLRYRGRGWILIPTLLALPIGYFAVLPILPIEAGTSTFATSYSGFLQAAAVMTAALLIALATQVRNPSRETRFVTREADVLALLWTGAAEIAVLVMLSPDASLKLQRPSFRLMLSGTVAGFVPLVLGASRSDSGAG